MDCRNASHTLTSLSSQARKGRARAKMRRPHASLEATSCFRRLRHVFTAIHVQLAPSGLFTGLSGGLGWVQESISQSMMFCPTSPLNLKESLLILGQLSQIYMVFYLEVFSEIISINRRSRRAAAMDSTSCLGCGSSPSPTSIESVGWVLESPGRGTLGLVLTCLFTVFICTWVVIHARVCKRPSLRRLHKVALLLKTIIAPEFIAVEGLQE